MGNIVNPDNNPVAHEDDEPKKQQESFNLSKYLEGELDPNLG